MCNNVEADGLGQRSALSDGHNIADLDLEGRGAVHGNVAVALLVPAVLANVVEVIPADHNGALHLGRDDNALQDTPADGDLRSEVVSVVDGDGKVLSREWVHILSCRVV